MNLLDHAVRVFSILEIACETGWRRPFSEDVPVGLDRVVLGHRRWNTGRYTVSTEIIDPVYDLVLGVCVRPHPSDGQRLALLSALLALHSFVLRRIS